LDKRLNPLEDRAGEGGGLVMTDMSVESVKDGNVGNANATQNTAHSE
jgi:hypothetical protein